VTLSASATDTRFNNSNGSEPTQAIAGAEYTIDVPPWSAGAVPTAMQASDGAFDTPTEGLAGSITTAGLAVGQHLVYVRARDASGVWGPVSAVFLNINPPPLPLGEVEPNNTLATAQVVAALPALYWGTMDSPIRSERSDTDIYRLTLPAGQSLTATLTPNASSDYNLEILGASGARLASSFLGTGQVDTATVNNGSAAAVTLYVRLTYASGGKGPVNGIYSLTLSAQ
jgi:hypothetical protein